LGFYFQRKEVRKMKKKKKQEFNVWGYICGYIEVALDSKRRYTRADYRNKLRDVLRIIKAEGKGKYIRDRKHLHFEPSPYFRSTRA